jgi:hypothetical protein
MRKIEIPTLRATDIIAVTLEHAELANCPVWIVTTREGLRRPPARRWYPEEAQALAHAAEQADRHGLLLIDLRDGSTSE